MPGKPFTQRPECGESRVSVCEKINQAILKIWRVYLRKNELQLGSAKPEVVPSAPPTGAWGETREGAGTKKGNDVIGYSFSPVGCLWLGVLSFSIMWPSGIYRPRCWFAYVGHHVIRAAWVCGLLVLINLTVQSWRSVGGPWISEWLPESWLLDGSAKVSLLLSLWGLTAGKPALPKEREGRGPRKGLFYEF